MRAAISAKLMSVLSSPSVLLSVSEAQRLLGLAQEACERILRRLEKNGVLQQLQRDVYAPGHLINGIPRL